MLHVHTVLLMFYAKIIVETYLIHVWILNVNFYEDWALDLFKNHFEFDTSVDQQMSTKVLINLHLFKNFDRSAKINITRT